MASLCLPEYYFPISKASSTRGPHGTTLWWIGIVLYCVVSYRIVSHRIVSHCIVHLYISCLWGSGWDGMR